MMLEGKLICKIILDFLGEDGITEYDERYDIRLMVQKLIYMFQEIGQIPGYSFSWYLAGPYSNQLTKTMFNDVVPQVESFIKSADELSLTDEGTDLFRKLHSFFDHVDDETLRSKKLRKFQWYELLASSHYIYKTTHNIERDMLIKRLGISKKAYTRSQIEFVVDQYFSIRSSGDIVN